MFIPKSILGLSLMAPTLVASIPHIYFGSLSGQGVAGTWGEPGQMSQCFYQVMKDDQSPCDGTRLDPADGSGGCQGQSGDPPNFCHQTIPHLGEGYELDRNGDACPADDYASDGVWYADVLDKNDGDAKVGRCVYEYIKGPNCASTGSFLTHKFVHCYPGA